MAFPPLHICALRFTFLIRLWSIVREWGNTEWGVVSLKLLCEVDCNAGHHTPSTDPIGAAFYAYRKAMLMSRHSKSGYATSRVPRCNLDSTLRSLCLQSILHHAGRNSECRAEPSPRQPQRQVTSAVAGRSPVLESPTAQPRVANSNVILLALPAHWAPRRAVALLQ